MIYYYVYCDFYKPKCIKDEFNQFVMDYLYEPINDD